MGDLWWWENKCALQVPACRALSCCCFFPPFLSFLNYAKLDVIPLMTVPRQARISLLCACICVCVVTSSDIRPVCDLWLSSSLLSDVFCLSSCSTLRARWTLQNSHTNTLLEIPKRQQVYTSVHLHVVYPPRYVTNGWENFELLAVHACFKPKTKRGVWSSTK